MRDLLPMKPVSLKVLDPWWTVHVGYVTEDDIKVKPLEASDAMVLATQMPTGTSKY